MKVLFSESNYCVSVTFVCLYCIVYHIQLLFINKKLYGIFKLWHLIFKLKLVFEKVLLFFFKYKSRDEKKIRLETQTFIL